MSEPQQVLYDATVTLGGGGSMRLRIEVPDVHASFTGDRDFICALIDRFNMALELVTPEDDEPSDLEDDDDAAGSSL